jgi:hypothetical protein
VENYKIKRATTKKVYYLNRYGDPLTKDFMLITGPQGGKPYFLLTHIKGHIKKNRKIKRC